MSNIYRKKPVVIEAEQFRGCGWYVKENLPYPKGVCFCPDVDDGGGSSHAHVHTIHDEQAVKLGVGDYIVPEPDGEHYYPCKPDIFEKTYEPVE